MLPFPQTRPALPQSVHSIDPLNSMFFILRRHISLFAYLTSHSIRGKIMNESGESPTGFHAAQCLVRLVSAPLTSMPRRLDTSFLILASTAKTVAVLG